MGLLEYLLVLTVALSCTAAPAADIPKDHCKAPPYFDDKALQGDWNAEYYSPGKLATYNCRPGFSRRGSISYTCTDGRWEGLARNGECIKKSCGYPGDIDFGSFELKNEEQFVFGATVIYSCNDGYKLASKQNKRDCTATGWSGYVPECEAIKCPPVTVDSDVTVISTSYDEEYSVNQVIRFECKNPNKELRGASDIVCTSSGKWNKEPPKCEDIKCDKPKIPNGQVTTAGERFNKDQSIEYTCDTKYKPSRTPRTTCTGAGWSPPPDCVEIFCSETFRNGKIPTRQDRYGFQDTARLECDEGYVTANTQGNPVMTCTALGWNPLLQCVSKKCDRPAIPNGKITDRTNYFPKDVGGYFVYWCNNGYVTSSRVEYSSMRVDCGPNGWIVEPRCYKICSLPSDGKINANLQRQQSTYIEGDSVRYQCYPDFTSSSGGNNIVIQCLPGGKTTKEKCSKHCKKPKLKNGSYKTDNNIFEVGKYFVYECEKGFLPENQRFEGRSECKGSVWDPVPQCSEQLCYINDEPIKYGQVIHFECKKDGILKSSGSSQCYYFGFSPEPYCAGSNESLTKTSKTVLAFTESTCPPVPMPPTAEVIKNENKGEYKNGDEVEIKCHRGSVLRGSNKIRCENGTWQLSFWCIKNGSCDEPERPENSEIVNQKQKYFNGDTVTYKCNPGYHIIGYENNTCIDEKWLPPPDCEGDSCANPPHIQHGKIKDSKDSKNIYKHGDTVTFECLEDYSLSGNGIAQCLTGKWSNSSTCVYSSCEPPPLDIEYGHLLGQAKPKYKTGEKAYYGCNQGYSMGKSGADVTCENKEWTTRPECKRIGEKCGPPPVVQYGDIEGISRLSYDSGASVKYLCANYYKLEGKPSIKCENGEWEKAPICRVPCTITFIAMENNNIKLAHKVEKKIYSEHFDNITFSCKLGYEPPKTTPMRFQCLNGVMPIPKCFLPGSCVLQEAEMLQRNINSDQSLEIGNGETIVFKCTEGNVVEGKLEAKCKDGKIDYPTCASAPSCVLQLEKMKQLNINYDGSSTEIQSGQTIRFACAEGMIEEEDESLVATCTEGEIKYPKCVNPKSCNISDSILEEKNIQLVPREDNSNIYQHEDTITVKCRATFRRPVTPTAKCVNGVVRSEKCFQKGKSLCRIQQESLDEKHFLDLNEKYNIDIYYEEGDTVRFKCKTGYSAQTEPIGTCSKPATLTFPTCTKLSVS